MGREIAELQKILLDAKEQSTQLNALDVLLPNEQNQNIVTSTSKVSNWRLWIWIVAFAQYIQEQYWDALKIELEERIATSRIHTPRWYREKALSFLYGVPLVPETDYYDTENLTPQQIESAKIISNAASIRVIQNGYGTLRLKVVRTVDGEYAPVLPEHLSALDVYFNEHVADAGTVVNVTTGNADLLKLKLDIYYDPLILGADGSRLDGTALTPVIDEINNFLKSIDFENGKLILTYLTDRIQKISGVVLPVVREAFSRYGDYQYTTEGVQNVGLINEIRVADSGYMKLDQESLLINYIAFTD